MAIVVKSLRKYMREANMEKDECLKKLETIEKMFSTLINTKLAGYSDEDRCVATQIINDTVDLIENLDRDAYAFDVAFNNYNNGISFMPQYYFENLVLHDDMIWERMLIIVSIAYQIDFEVIFEKKGIGFLYKIIKKDITINNDIKRILKEINEDYKMKLLKFVRNDNEHYISTHLSNSSERDKCKVDIKDIIYVENGVWYGNIEQINNLIDNTNKEEMALLKKKISIIQLKRDKYIDLLKLCIDQMESSFRDNLFKFEQKKHFLPDYNKQLCVSKDIWIKCEELEEKFGNLREKLRCVINLINKNVILALDEASRIRNTLLIDSLFRAKEILRSITIYYRCVFYDKELWDNEQNEIFKKYYLNEVMSQDDYFNHAMFKLYSVYEKIAKFLLCKYDFKKEYVEDSKFKNVYIEVILKLFYDQNIKSDILTKFIDCVSSREYKEYEEIRNREYHCLRTVYVLDEECRQMYINDSICKIEKLMSMLYQLFLMIIDEEKMIYEKISLNYK